MNTMMWRFTEGNAQPEEIDMIWELSKQVNSKLIISWKSLTKLPDPDKITQTWQNYPILTKLTNPDKTTKHPDWGPHHLRFGWRSCLASPGSYQALQTRAGKQVNFHQGKFDLLNFSKFKSTFQVCGISCKSCWGKGCCQLRKILFCENQWTLCNWTPMPPFSHPWWCECHWTVAKMSSSIYLISRQYSQLDSWTEILNLKLYHDALITGRWWHWILMSRVVNVLRTLKEKSLSLWDWEHYAMWCDRYFELV